MTYFALSLSWGLTVSSKVTLVTFEGAASYYFEKLLLPLVAGVAASASSSISTNSSCLTSPS